MARTPKDPTVAFLLELLLGLFFQWFGWGHIYAGRILKGILVMVSYWVLQGINYLLLFILIGWVTMPLTLILYLIFSSMGARRAAEETLRGTV